VSIIYDALQKTQQNRALLREKPDRLCWFDMGLLGVIGFLLISVIVAYYPRVMKHFQHASLAAAQQAAAKSMPKTSAVVPVQSRIAGVKHTPAPAHTNNVKHNAAAPHRPAAKAAVPVQHVAARSIPRIVVSQPVRLSPSVPLPVRAAAPAAPAVVAQAQPPAPAKLNPADVILTPQQMLPQISLPAPVVVAAQPSYIAKPALDALEPFDIPKPPAGVLPPAATVKVETAGVVLNRPSYLQKPSVVSLGSSSITERPVDITSDDLDPNKLVLNGVFLSDKEKVALINNRSFRLGDVLAGMKIIEIDNDSIKLLSSDNKKVVLLRIVA